MLFLTLLFFSVAGYAQTGHFTHQVAKVEGDLNKDNLADYAIVTQDTLQDTAPYRLQVFFAKPSGGHSLIISTEKAMEPQFPNGRQQHTWGNGFAGLSIHAGVLWIETELIRGHYEHKFRYQNGHFELIGYTYVNSDGLGKIYSVDFNLSTGVYVSKVEPYGLNEEKTTSRTEKKLLRPLPALETFDPESSELY